MTGVPAGLPAQEPVGVACTVNGAAVEASVPPRLLLSDFLRHELGLTGTHVGCEHGVCGSCTVLVDGAAVRSCLLLAVQVAGAEIVTVEGAQQRRAGDALQRAFSAHHGLQCGFCTPGFLMSAVELLERDPDLDDEAIVAGLGGNLCRCTGYLGIVAAVRSAAAAVRADEVGDGPRA